MNNLLGMNYIDTINIERKIFRNFFGKSVLPYMGESDQSNKILVSVLMSLHSMCSINQVLHYMQLIKTGHFQKFDHGRAQNNLLYSQTSPPDYNLKAAVAPVAIYYGKTDLFTVVEDVEKLIAELPNVVKSYLVPTEKFNHVDFIFGDNAPAQLYDEIVKTIKSL